MICRNFSLRCFFNSVQERGMQSTKEFWSRRQLTDSSNIEDWLLTRQFSYSSRRRRRARSEGRPASQHLLHQDQNKEELEQSLPPAILAASTRSPPAVQYLRDNGRPVSQYIDRGGGRPSSQYLEAVRPSSVFVDTTDAFSPTSSPFLLREVRREVVNGGRPSSLYIQSEEGRAATGGRSGSRPPLSPVRDNGQVSLTDEVRGGGGGGGHVTSLTPPPLRSGGGGTAASSPSEDSGNSSLNTSTTDSRRSAAGLHKQRRPPQQAAGASRKAKTTGHQRGSSVPTDNNSSNVLAIQEAASARKGHHYTTASPTTKEYRQAAEAIAEAREAKQVKRRSHHYPDMARTNYMENRWSSIYSDTELYARVSRKNKD